MPSALADAFEDSPRIYRSIATCAATFAVSIVVGSIIGGGSVSGGTDGAGMPAGALAGEGRAAGTGPGGVGGLALPMGQAAAAAAAGRVGGTEVVGPFDLGCLAFAPPKDGLWAENMSGSADAARVFASMALAIAATAPVFFAAGGLRLLLLAGSFLGTGAGALLDTGGRTAAAAFAPDVD